MAVVPISFWVEYHLASVWRKLQMPFRIELWKPCWPHPLEGFLPISNSSRSNNFSTPLALPSWPTRLGGETHPLCPARVKTMVEEMVFTMWHGMTKQGSRNLALPYPQVSVSVLYPFIATTHHPPPTTHHPPPTTHHPPPTTHHQPPTTHHPPPTTHHPPPTTHHPPPTTQHPFDSGTKSTATQLQAFDPTKYSQMSFDSGHPIYNLSTS